MSSFFLLFSISALVLGRVGDRVSPLVLPGLMALIWTLSQAMLFAPASIAILFASRVVLGAGEGPAFPTALHIGYATVDVKRWPFVTGIILAGAPLGTALAAWICTWTMVHFGWRAAFGLLSFVSLGWAVVWVFFCLTNRPAVSALLPPAIRVRPDSSIFVNKTIAGAMLASFAAYAAGAIALAWYPKILQYGGLSPGNAGSLLAGLWALQIPFCLAGAWMLERALRGAENRTRTLGRFGAAAVAVCGASLIGLSFNASGPPALVCMALSLIATIVFFTTAGPLVAENTPTELRGTALGALVAVYSLAGICAPFVFGAVVDAAPESGAGYGHALLFSGISIVFAAAGVLYLLSSRGSRTDITVRAGAS